MNINKVKIDSIKYTNKDKKVTCIVKWYNPVTSCIQKVKGVAKCNPDDTFNLVKGQRIAESRAKIVMWYKYLFALHKEGLKAVNKHDNLIEKELNHLRNLINK